jgi:hypothetical protein
MVRFVPIRDVTKHGATEFQSDISDDVGHKKAPEDPGALSLWENPKN